MTWAKQGGVSLMLDVISSGVNGVAQVAASVPVELVVDVQERLQAGSRAFCARVVEVPGGSLQLSYVRRPGGAWMIAAKINGESDGSFPDSYVWVSVGSFESLAHAWGVFRWLQSLDSVAIESVYWSAFHGVGGS